MKMRIPTVVNEHTFTVYVNLRPTQKLQLQADNFNWDEKLPKYLREICLETIAENWKEKPILRKIPILADRLFLCDILATDLPLELTVPIIQYDIYWKRCYKSRWPQDLPSKLPNEEIFNDYFCSTSTSVISSRSSLRSINTNKDNSTLTLRSSLEPRITWKGYYLERHVKEYLQKLKPEDYNPEKIKVLSETFNNHIKNLELDELQVPSQEIGHHIPLGGILSGLNNLTELSLCFQQTYVGSEFSWHIFKVTNQDIIWLGKGLERLSFLKILKIVKSDIDDEKLEYILAALKNNESLEELDFSHCYITDNGVDTLAKFLLEQQNIKYVNLTNNKLGSKGAKALASILSQPDCKIINLILRLNYIENSGADAIFEILEKSNNSIKSLCLSACGLKKGIKIVEFIKTNTSVDTLNIENNKIEEARNNKITTDYIQKLMF